MSSVVGRTLNIEPSNVASYGTADSGMSLNYKVSSTQTVAMRVKTGNELSYTLNSSAKAVLYPNSVTHPIKADVTIRLDRPSTLGYRKTYGNIKFGGSAIIDEVINTADGGTFTNTNVTTSAVTDSTAGTAITAGLHSEDTGYQSFMEWFSITLYFTRYDISATAGTGIVSTSVSSSTGFNGDTIQYRCALAGGSTWIGWYQNGTLYSSTKDLNVTVNGTDLVLEARATAPLTTLLTASYNGSNIISEQKAGAVSYSYGSISGTITSGQTKTMQCGGKVCLSNIVIGGRILPCSGHLMATDVVITYQ